MIREPNTECVRRILYLHGIEAAIIEVDQRTAKVDMVLEATDCDKQTIATELYEWCGFRFVLYDRADSDSAEYRTIVANGQRLLVSPPS